MKYPFHLLPEVYWKEDRLKEIKKVIENRSEAGLYISVKWAEERDELIKWLEEYQSKNKK